MLFTSIIIRTYLLQSKDDDTITIIGSKEGIEKAMHRIKVISDEQVFIARNFHYSRSQSHEL